jgi:uncharacterized protein with NRDE domain
MCLILLAWQEHARYPCVLAANRDEMHLRPAAAAQWWQTHPPILAGRDLSEGGTWLGLARSGRFAALTNYRDPELRRSGTPSRGSLVTSILLSGDTIDESLRQLRAVSADYNGFNLIFSDGERLAIYESVTQEGRELGPGIYGLSNHLLDTPWPKVEMAKSRMSKALSDLTSAEPLLALLRDDTPAPDEQLPRTGLSLEWERLLSSAFIRAPDYGTRCSTVLRFDDRRQAYFDEWSWNSAGEETQAVHFQFELCDKMTHGIP